MTIVDRSLLERSAVEKATSGYEVALASSFTSVLDLWGRIADDGAALPFQGRTWLEAWSATLGRSPGLELIAATIHDAEGVAVMALPLVRRRAGLLRTIAFADGGLTDYNAPVLSSRAPRDVVGAKAIWHALSRALPAGDVLRFERMPHRVGGLINPFALLPGVRPSNAVGLALTLHEGFASWRGALPRHFRKELGRCDRLFDAMPRARFIVMDEHGVAGERGPIYEALEVIQRERIAALGLRYDLDRAAPRAFYRALAASGDGSIMTAMVADDAVVAVLLGLREESTFVMLRLAAAGGIHAKISPGRQIIARTIEALNLRGVTTFDFALGDYDYKRRLGGEPVALIDMVEARSPLGLYALADFHAQAFIRADPRRKAVAKRIRAALFK